MVDTNVLAKARQASVSRGAEGALAELRALRDGSLVQIPWLQALALEGRIFGVHGGAASLDVNTVAPFGNDGTDGEIDMDEHDMLITIPETVVVIPTFYWIGFVGIGTIDQNHTCFWWGNSGVVGANPVTFTPFNLKPGSNNKSACTAQGLADNGGTAITVDGVIYSEARTALTGAAANAAAIGIHWSARESAFIPVLEGLSGTGRQLAAAACGQTATGYMTINWAELPISTVA